MLCQSKNIAACAERKNTSCPPVFRLPASVFSSPVSSYASSTGGQPGNSAR